MDIREEIRSTLAAMQVEMEKFLASCDRITDQKPCHESTKVSPIIACEFPKSTVVVDSDKSDEEENLDVLSSTHGNTIISHSMDLVVVNEDSDVHIVPVIDKREDDLIAYSFNDKVPASSINGITPRCAISEVDLGIYINKGTLSAGIWCLLHKIEIMNELPVSSVLINDKKCRVQSEIIDRNNAHLVVGDNVVNPYSCIHWNLPYNMLFDNQCSVMSSICFDLGITETMESVCKDFQPDFAQTMSTFKWLGQMKVQKLESMQSNQCSIIFPRVHRDIIAYKQLHQLDNANDIGFLDFMDALTIFRDVCYMLTVNSYQGLQLQSEVVHNVKDYGGISLFWVIHKLQLHTFVISQGLHYWCFDPGIKLTLEGILCYALTAFFVNARIASIFGTEFYEVHVGSILCLRRLFTMNIIALCGAVYMGNVLALTISSTRQQAGKGLKQTTRVAFIIPELTSCLNIPFQKKIQVTKGSLLALFCHKGGSAPNQTQSEMPIQGVVHCHFCTDPPSITTECMVFRNPSWLGRGPQQRFLGYKLINLYGVCLDVIFSRTCCDFEDVCLCSWVHRRALAASVINN